MSLKKQQKLTFFMPKSSTDKRESLQGNDDNESSPPPTTESTEKVPVSEMDSHPSSGNQPKRNYQEKWERLYSWLEYDDKAQLKTCKSKLLDKTSQNLTSVLHCNAGEIREKEKF